MQLSGPLQLSLAIGQFMFWGCGQSANRPEAKESIDKSEIALDSFTGIPQEIQGCSCYFSESEESRNEGEYLLLDGFDSVAFISINNSLLKLKLVSTGREPLSFGDYDHIDVYKADKYTITLDIKYKELPKDDEAEGWFNDGTIVIERNDGQKKVPKVIGFCGC